jgi:uncharacterized protein YukE
MADHIKVQYANMDAGVASMLGATSKLNQYAEDMYAAITKASASWDAASQRQAHQAYVTAKAQVTDIAQLIRTHSSVLADHSESTAQLDNKLAAQFDH